MSDLPSSAAPKGGIPVWGILLIVGVGLVVAVVVFFGILGLTSMTAGGSPQGVPGAGATDPAQPGVEDEGAYSSAEFGYEIEFPGQPLESSVTQTVSGHQLETVTVAWVSGDRNISINTTAFPDDLYSADEIDSMLEGSLQGASGAVNGTLDDVHYLEVDGERAIGGVITAVGNEVFMTVLFHDQVQFTIASVNGTQADHDAFVGSLQFTD